MAGYNCEYCCYYEYDEDEEAYVCSVDMDEDDYARLACDKHAECPFFRQGDEYLVVRKQM